ncbi:MAG: hypothetical protein Q9160_003916 [Pyrenula sp. 1 TL-2023]
MDLSHSDDEMQTHSDTILPEELELDEADVMRDASIEPDQDLMNQDPVDINYQAGDDDMVDEEAVDEDTMTMADDVDVDVDQNIDSYEDEDIIYEDDDEVVNAVNFDSSAEHGFQNAQSTNEQSLAEQPSNDHTPTGESLHVGLQGQQNTAEIDPSNEGDRHEQEQANYRANTASSGTLSENDTITTAKEPSSSIGYVGSTSNVERHVLSGAVAENDNLNPTSNNTSNVDEPPSLQNSEFDQTASGEPTIIATDSNEDLFNTEGKTQHDGLVESEVSQTLNALDPDSADADDAKDLHENSDEAGFNFNDTKPFQHGLHPVTIHYAQAEFSLFPPHDEDDASDFFVEDESLAQQGLDKLLCTCREVLAGSIGDHDEVILDIPSLGLHISEGSSYANQISLAQILDVYLSLHHNDGKPSINPLICELQTRLCLTSQYNSLQRAAKGGKGMSDIPKSVLTQPSQPEYNEGASQGAPATKDERHGNVETSSTSLQTMDSGRKATEPDKLSANDETEDDRLDSAKHGLENASKFVQSTSAQPTNGSTYEEKEVDRIFAVSDAVEPVQVSGDEQDNSATEGRTHPLQDQQIYLLMSDDDQIFPESGADLHESSGDNATILTTQTSVPKEPYPDEHNPSSNDLLDFDTSDQNQTFESIDATEGDDETRTLEPESTDFPPSERDRITTNEEELVGELNANVLDNSMRTQLSGNAEPEHENVPYEIEGSTVLASNVPSNHQFSEDHQGSGNVDQLDHNVTSAVEEDQVDPDKDGYDLVDVNDGDAAQDFDEVFDAHENDLQSDSAPKSGTIDAIDGTGLDFGKPTNVGNLATTESDFEKTELDTIDFDFVEAEEDVFFEEPLMQSQATQSADQASTSLEHNSAFNTIPRSSKRKAQDPIDDYETIETAPSDAKRRRSS